METHIMDRRQLMVKRIMVKVKQVGQDGQNRVVGQDGPVEQNCYHQDLNWVVLFLTIKIFGCPSLPRGHVDLTASPTVKIADVRVSRSLRDHLRIAT